MQLTDYHKRIIDYYAATENAYKDSWDLDKSLSIHYGYWDNKVKSFSQSLLRMNEIMMTMAAIKQSDQVLDAGCGVGGSAIYLAKNAGCSVTGISLSERQVKQAIENAEKNGVDGLIDFKVMDYCATDFPNNSFDVIWGCESICYAEDKQKFINEAYRVLKPGGRLVIADGFVTRYANNDHPTIRKWLDGWQVNYLETPRRFSNLLELACFSDVKHENISKFVAHSARRLLKYYFLGKIYLAWKSLTFSNRASSMQKNNIKACWHQYLGLWNGLWSYGIITALKK
jgi:tocopherol O-methyltransferase